MELELQYGHISSSSLPNEPPCPEDFCERTQIVCSSSTMGGEVDALSYLRINVAEIKKLGKQWGLSEEEIDKCIDKALEKDLGDVLKTKASWKFFHVCWLSVRVLTKFVFYLMLSAVLLGGGIFVLTFIHEPSGQYIEKTLAPYTYDVFRLIRLAALPLHKRFQFTEYYDAECLIENPLFKQPPVDCFLCSSVKRVKDVPANFTNFKLLRTDKPVIYRNRSDHNVTFEDLVKMYKKEPAVFDSNIYAYKYTDPSVQTLNDLFQDGMFNKIKNSHGFHVELQTRRLATAYALRQLYRRPQFIRKRSEVGLGKTLIIDGPSAPHTRLEPGFFDGTWLVQSYGHRMVFLNVPGSCVKECRSLKVTLNSGDILFYDSLIWTADLLPTGDDASITFKGHFVIL